MVTLLRRFAVGTGSPDYGTLQRRRRIHRGSQRDPNRLMFLKNLKYAMRQLRKTPGFTLTAVLTLALGIGASTAVFTVIDSVVLKPLAYRASGELVVVWERVKFLGKAIPYTGPNPRDFARWQQQAASFQGMALFGVGSQGVALGAGHPRVVGSVKATPNVLGLLDVSPLLGRGFSSDDAAPGRDHVAILTYPLWQSLFHGDPNVIGKTMRVAGAPYDVIGVLPRSFRFPKRSVLNSFPSGQSANEAPEIGMLTPLAIKPNEFGWNSDYGNVIALGRLKPGSSVRQAEEQLNAIEEDIVREMPASERDNTPHALTTYVQPMQDAMVGDTRKGLWLLMAAVIGLMLIASVNLANAQLGRAIARQHESAVRSALGASKWQMLGTSLVESLLLAAAGGIAGVGLAEGGVTLFRRYAPIDLPRMAEIQPNVSVLFFALVLVAGSGILFGLVPAVKSLATEPQQALQQNNSRTQGSRGSHQLRSWLIGFQVFACTALLLVTGLFAKSLFTLLTSDKGFETEHVAIAQVDLSQKAYGNSQQRITFDDAVLEKLRTLPGVQSAGLVSAMPLEGETWIDGLVPTDRPQNHNAPLVNMRWVSPGYFETIREKLAAGRLFDERDKVLHSAVISESAARAGWPDENASGRQFKKDNFTYTVIGVVADARNNSLKLPPANMVYLPYQDRPPRATFFLLRSAQEPSLLIDSIRRTIWNQDPEVTIARIKTLDSQVRDSLASERFQTAGLAAFGIAALLLAMVGIYGVLSYAVAGRKQEIGIRMALGATRQNIYALAVREAAIAVFAGLAMGWLASIALARTVRSLLYGVDAADLRVTIMVATLFLIAAGAAAFFPARRAASIEPLEALRAE
jgi:predicted permease